MDHAVRRTKESKARRRGLGTDFRLVSHHEESVLLRRRVMLPPITPKSLELDFSSVCTPKQEMVDRFDGLTANRASTSILETMPPPTLRRPTLVEEGKPHKETKGIRRVHLPE
jgi:hypothetical protein